MAFFYVIFSFAYIDFARFFTFIVIELLLIEIAIEIESKFYRLWIGV